MKFTLVRISGVTLLIFILYLRFTYLNTFLVMDCFFLHIQLSRICHSIKQWLGTSFCFGNLLLFVASMSFKSHLHSEWIIVRSYFITSSYIALGLKGSWRSSVSNSYGLFPWSSHTIGTKVVSKLLTIIEFELIWWFAWSQTNHLVRKQKYWKKQKS